MLPEPELHLGCGGERRGPEAPRPAADCGSGLGGSGAAPLGSVLPSDDLQVVAVLVRRLLREVPDLWGEFLQFLQGKPVDGGVVEGVQVPRVGRERHLLRPFQDLKSIGGRSYVRCRTSPQSSGGDEDGVKAASAPLCSGFCR